MGDNGAFNTNDKLICRCNEEFVNTGSDLDLPYDIVTCNKGSWTGTIGTCQPLECSNPKDLMVDGVIVGIPEGKSTTDWRASVGESITYKCADGYQAKDGNAPTSLCVRKPLDKLKTTDDMGQLGFFADIVGECEPIAKTCAPLATASEENAWEPVYLGSGAITTCHAADFWRDNANINPDFQDSAESPAGTKAVFECYDDFIAHKQTDFLKKTYDITEEIHCATGDKSDDAECQEEIDAMNKAVDYFTYVCPGQTLVSTKEKTGDSSSITNMFVATTCGLIPAIFYGN